MTPLTPYSDVRTLPTDLTLTATVPQVVCPRCFLLVRNNGTCGTIGCE